MEEVTEKRLFGMNSKRLERTQPQADLRREQARAILRAASIDLK